MRTMQGHKDAVVCLAADLSGARLVSGSADGTCRVWDLRAPGGARGIHAAIVGEVSAVALGEETLLVASGMDLLAFDLAKVLLREPSRRLEALAAEEINEVVVDVAGRLAAVAEDSGAVHLVNLHTWRLERTFAGKRGHTNLCSSVALRPGRDWGLASGGMDAAVILWQRSGRAHTVSMRTQDDERSAGVVHGPQLCNPPFVHSLVYAPSGETLFAGLGDGSLVVLNAATGEQLQRLRGGHAAAVCQVTCAPCGVITGGNDQAICLWRYTGKELSERPEVRLRHKEKINWLTWAADELFVADLGCGIAAYAGLR